MFPGIHVATRAMQHDAESEVSLGHGVIR